MKKKKIPLRKCISCGENKTKEELIRIVLNKEEGILIDPTYKMNGRGAYICKDKACIEKAMKDKKLNHAFKTNVNQEVYEELLSYVDD
ncbi:MAG: YlxR family protein [Finegoldia sp.]|nr:YlxR family protein [Finegoldia sp.]